MNKVQLSDTGIKVSPLCMGTMTFAREADEAMSQAMFNQCLEAGVNFFDSANVYSRGAAETLLGKLIKGKRDQLVITSKVGMKMGDAPEDNSLSAAAITKHLDQSLARLGTDRLDVYFVHRFDDDVPLPDTLGALDETVKSGKVRCLGASNFAAWQLAKARGISAAEGWAQFKVMQPMYNLLKRQAEVELLPMALSENIAVTPYNPLAAGMLSGKYLTDDRGPDARLDRQANYAARYGEAVYEEVTRRFVDHAKQRGIHPVTLANAWVMHHPAVTAPILGARSTEQLAPALAAAELKLSEDEYQAISALGVEPPPATDRLEDKR